MPMKPVDILRQNLVRIFRECKDAEITQEFVAARAGVRQGQISQWSKGLLPRTENLPGLSKALEISIDDLYREDGWKRAGILTGTPFPKETPGSTSPGGQNSAEPLGESKRSIFALVSALNDAQAAMVLKGLEQYVLTLPADEQLRLKRSKQD